MRADTAELLQSIYTLSQLKCQQLSRYADTLLEIKHAVIRGDYEMCFDRQIYLDEIRGDVESTVYDITRSRDTFTRIAGIDPLDAQHAIEKLDRRASEAEHLIEKQLQRALTIQAEIENELARSAASCAESIEELERMTSLMKRISPGLDL